MPLSIRGQAPDSKEQKGIKCAAEVTDTVLYVWRIRGFFAIHIGQSRLSLVSHNK
ncbi:hypothetical protein COMA1_20186 [Candidatus Nitrospira nitrosa]|uniref:Uncharacterized protein n=1 Tax=Candidatus Nitrospira nitrosa TaxID=1742972 RepID=A0A0S4LED9_9BACT|nr:hypothetical protein COMA1_20186 [Candidatus Nitrospira nitrosa]